MILDWFEIWEHIEMDELFYETLAISPIIQGRVEYVLT